VNRPPPQHTAPSTAASAKSATAVAELDALTDKEERILDLLAEGKSNKQIAAEIFWRRGRSRIMSAEIMDKLHARSRIELAMHASKRRG
jgi:DNA-binding NarL/FixJ family response regulator